MTVTNNRPYISCHQSRVQNSGRCDVYFWGKYLNILPEQGLNRAKLGVCVCVGRNVNARTNKTIEEGSGETKCFHVNALKGMHSFIQRVAVFKN